MNRRSRRAREDEPATYEIKIRGRLKAEWSDWLNGMSLQSAEEADGEPVTSIVGPVMDQAALRGLLNKIWNLNLSLISVNRCETTGLIREEVQTISRGEMQNEHDNGTRDVT